MKRLFTAVRSLVDPAFRQREIWAREAEIRMRNYVQPDPAVPLGVGAGAVIDNRLIALGYTYDDAIDADGDALIRALEARHSVSLPDDYRAFLRAWPCTGAIPGAFVTGGEPGPGASDGTYPVESLFAASPYPNRDLVGLAGTWESLDLALAEVDEPLVCIGEDVSGDAFLMRLAGPCRGQVVFWDHELTVAGRFSSVASSFTEFISALDRDDD